MFTPNHILLYLGLGFILVELVLGAATGFDLLLVGTTLVIGSAVSFAFDSFSAGIISTLVLSISYFLFGRAFIKRGLTVATHTTNTDKLIGQEALVIKPIAPHHPGQVSVHGEIWLAAAKQTLSEGQKVVIKSVEGITLNVQKVN